MTTLCLVLAVGEKLLSSLLPHPHYIWEHMLKVKISLLPPTPFPLNLGTYALLFRRAGRYTVCYDMTTLLATGCWLKSTLLPPTTPPLTFRSTYAV